ncbi:MAG: thioesterase family protein [Geminicoccaceae bacterium]
MPDPLPPYRTTVQSAWLDYNGHLNEAYYLLIFSYATDTLLDAVELDAASREKHQVSAFTLETHLCYLAEVSEGAEVEVEVQVLGADEKRMHIFSEMRRVSDGAVSATAEMILVNVDMTTRRTAPFRPETRARLDAFAEASRAKPWPERAGRAVRGVRPAAAA